MHSLGIFSLTFFLLMSGFFTLILTLNFLDPYLRTFFQHRGAQEICPKCGDSIPLGTLSRIAAKRVFAPSALFASSIPRFDGQWEERGLLGFARSGTTCSECRTMHPSSWRKPSRPSLVLPQS